MPAWLSEGMRLFIMFGAAQHEDTAVSQAKAFVRFSFFFVLIYSGRNIMDTELWYDGFVEISQGVSSCRSGLM